MVIDDRRDHSFRLPRPDLTISTGSPNACDGCHADRGAAWADAKLDEWFGPARPAHYANAIHAGRQMTVGANRLLADAAANTDFPGIARASALSLIMPPLDSLAAAALGEGLGSTDPLIRLGALRGLQAVPGDRRVVAASPLLDDPVRAVRVEAVRVISPLQGLLESGYRAAFDAAEDEYIEAQLAIAERPEAQANLGAIYLARGDIVRAEESYRRALAMESRAVAARANLADMYRQLARDGDARTLLLQGLEIDPDSAALHHSLGLLYARSNESQAALEALRQANDLDPQNNRYAYVYAVALNSLGQPDAAIAAMRVASERFPRDLDIGWGLMSMLAATGRVDEARIEGKRLQEIYPENSDIGGFLASLTSP